MRFTTIGSRTSACLADTSFLSRTPGAPILRRQDTVRRLLDPTGLLASDRTYPSHQLLRPRVGTRLELKLQTAQSTPLKISCSVSTSPWPARTDDGTCRLGHQVNRPSTSAKASHNPSAPIACCWPPSGEARRKAWPPWTFEMRNGSPVAIFAGRQWRGNRCESEMNRSRGWIPTGGLRRFRPARCTVPTESDSLPGGTLGNSSSNWQPSRFDPHPPSRPLVLRYVRPF